MKNAGVVIPTEGAGIEELGQFQHHLTEYKINVYKYGTKGREVLFEGPQADKRINLLYHQSHFNVITSLTSAFVCRYFCEACHVPFNNKGDHRCERSCVECGSSPPCEKEPVMIKCDDCGRSFASQGCYDKHKIHRFPQLFPMALSALLKAFGLPSPKGYFPHLFNIEANANYLGFLPAVEYYSPDAMKPEARADFLK
ncbi:hypothetical protein ILUMI_11438, partial [Ignelater luminosus]